MHMTTPKVTGHAISAGISGGVLATHTPLQIAWTIALISLAITLGLALIRFIPKKEV